MSLIESTLSRLSIAEPALFRNLAIYPLRDPGAGPASYLLLDDLLSANLAQIAEVSEGGSVPEVSFTNLADRPALLVDGEELVGAKQNRVLNLTILVAAGRKIRVPVSCVEAGRWQYRSRHFKAAEHKLYLRARAMKMAQVSESMRRGTRQSDQGAIWNDIASKMTRMKFHSPTMNMQDLYDDKAGEIAAYVHAFSTLPDQVGAIFAINGCVMGAELFDSPATLARYFRKLISSYAMDALDVDEQHTARPSDTDVLRFLGDMGAAPRREFQAIGEGQDLRLEGERLTGGALVVGERLVHLAAFRKDGALAA